MNVTKGTQVNLKDKMVLTYCLVILLVLILIDLVADYDRSLTIIELLSDTFLEIGILVLTLYMSKYLWLRFVDENQTRLRAEVGLEQALNEVRRLEVKERQEQIQFDVMCEELFNSWAMTKSEREVAHLLVGTRSLKDIASHRFTSEGTIKNQARSIYHKAGVKNRTEFMAQFIERFAR